MEHDDTKGYLALVVLFLGIFGAGFVLALIFKLTLPPSLHLAGPYMSDRILSLTSNAREENLLREHIRIGCIETDPEVKRAAVKDDTGSSLNLFSNSDPTQQWKDSGKNVFCWDFKTGRMFPPMTWNLSYN
jgi:hypothetical protein